MCLKNPTFNTRDLVCTIP
uniref:Uncharacterized protein n=1 Tax=Arundo donax TaxID=35708 RepID=A0A0A8YSF0_ARUDO